MNDGYNVITYSPERHILNLDTQFNTICVPRDEKSLEYIPSIVSSLVAQELKFPNSFSESHCDSNSINETFSNNESQDFSFESISPISYKEKQYCIENEDENTVHLTNCSTIKVSGEKNILNSQEMRFKMNVDKYIPRKTSHHNNINSTQLSGLSSLENANYDRDFLKSDNELVMMHPNVSTDEEYNSNVMLSNSSESAPFTDFNESNPRYKIEDIECRLQCYNNDKHYLEIGDSNLELGQSCNSTSIRFYSDSISDQDREKISSDCKIEDDSRIINADLNCDSIGLEKDEVSRMKNPPIYENVTSPIRCFQSLNESLSGNGIPVATNAPYTKLTPSFPSVDIFLSRPHCTYSESQTQIQARIMVLPLPIVYDAEFHHNHLVKNAISTKYFNVLPALIRGVTVSHNNLVSVELFSAQAKENDQLKHEGCIYIPGSLLYLVGSNDLFIPTVTYSSLSHIFKSSSYNSIIMEVPLGLCPADSAPPETVHDAEKLWWNLSQEVANGYRDNNPICMLRLRSSNAVNSLITSPRFYPSADMLKEIPEKVELQSCDTASPKFYDDLDDRLQQHNISNIKKFNSTNTCDSISGSLSETNGDFLHEQFAQNRQNNRGNHIYVDSLDLDNQLNQESYRNHSAIEYTVPTSQYYFNDLDTLNTSTFNVLPSHNDILSKTDTIAENFTSRHTKSNELCTHRSLAGSKYCNLPNQNNLHLNIKSKHGQLTRRSFYNIHNHDSARHYVRQSDDHLSYPPTSSVSPENDIYHDDLLYEPNRSDSDDGNRTVNSFNSLEIPSYRRTNRYGQNSEDHILTLPKDQKSISELSNPLNQHDYNGHYQSLSYRSNSLGKNVNKKRRNKSRHSTNTYYQNYHTLPRNPSQQIHRRNSETYSLSQDELEVESRHYTTRNSEHCLPNSNSYYYENYPQKYYHEYIQPKGSVSSDMSIPFQSQPNHLCRTIKRRHGVTRVPSEMLINTSTQRKMYSNYLDDLNVPLTRSKSLYSENDQDLTRNTLVHKQKNKFIYPLNSKNKSSTLEYNQCLPDRRTLNIMAATGIGLGSFLWCTYYLILEIITGIGNSFYHFFEKIFYKN